MNPSRILTSTHTLTRRPLSSLARNTKSHPRFLSAQPTSRPNTTRRTARSPSSYLLPLPTRTRPFSYSHAPQNNTPTTFTDPARSDLFYHLVPPPNPLSSVRPAFAVSFLESPPPSSKSSTVLGWLPAEAPGKEDEAGLNDFEENSAFLLTYPCTFLTYCALPVGLTHFAGGFRELLHRAISSGLSEGVDDIQIAGAMQTGQGWMHINGM